MGGGSSINLNSKTPLDVANSLDILGISYKKYKETIISNGISGIFLESLHSLNEIDDALKLLSVKSRLHRKVIKAHLLYLKKSSLASKELNFNEENNNFLNVSSDKMGHEDKMVEKISDFVNIKTSVKKELNVEKLNNIESSATITKKYNKIIIIESSPNDPGDEIVVKILQILVNRYKSKYSLQPLNFDKVLNSFNKALYEFANDSGKLTVDNIISSLIIIGIVIDKHQSMKIIRSVNAPSANNVLTVINMTDYFLNQLRNNPDLKTMNIRNTISSPLQNTVSSPLKISNNSENNRASFLRWKRIKKNLNDIKQKEDIERKLDETIEIYMNRPKSANWSSPKVQKKIGLANSSDKLL